jgi:glycosyltransferase involved in cell wall biosynthesis
MRIRIVSAVRSRASWAKVARCLAAELSVRGAEVMIEEDEDGVPAPEMALDEQVVAALGNHFARPDVDLLIVRPERFAHYGRAGLRTGYMVFEADRWPTSWMAAASDHLHIVFTPSNFCRNALVASDMPADRIAVLPHGVEPSLYRPRPRNAADGRHRLLFVGSPSRRKGLELLLEALLDDRLRSDSFSLTVKTETWPSRADEARRVAERVGAVIDRGTPVRFIERSYGEADMARLYGSHDLFCAPHMGEGFGMCILEAMACACPAVATAWSGPCDFYGAACGWPITEFALIRDDLPLPASFPTVAGAQMALPSTNGIAEALSAAVRAGAVEYARRSKSAAEVGAALTWSRIAEDFLSITSSHLAERAQ